MRDEKLTAVAWLVILLAVVCIPRITIDIYLPSLPAIGSALRLSDFELNLTMTAYMAGYAVSMLICGPLADMYGRRPVLIGGTILYLAATIVCAIADSAVVLITARLMQALGGCCGTVVGRAIVRDRFEKSEQASYLSWISTGMALSPIIAPLIGSIIDAMLGWRWVFVTLASVASCILVALCTIVPETRPDQTSASIGLNTTLRLYARLLQDRHFLRYSIIISGIYCTYFPFVSESSIVLQRGMGLSQTGYALVFSLTIMGYLYGAWVFRKKFNKWGADGVIKRAIYINIISSTLWVSAISLLPNSLVALVVPMILIMTSVGMVIPACQFSVLQPYSTSVGTVSGMFFFIQMALTALCSLFTAYLSDGTSYPMAIITLSSSVLLSVFGCVFWSGRRRDEQTSVSS